VQTRLPPQPQAQHPQISRGIAPRAGARVLAALLRVVAGGGEQHWGGGAAVWGGGVAGGELTPWPTT
jgi:hypothetical protein